MPDLFQPKPLTPDDPRHGTYAGRLAHRAQAIPICEPCRIAYNEYQKQHRGNGKRQTAARSRALWRLARRYPDEFRTLYLEEIGAPEYVEAPGFGSKFEN